jgi:hypothetical protein
MGRLIEPVWVRVRTRLLPAHFMRAPRYPSQNLLRVRFGLGLLLALGLLAALGYVVGNGPVEGYGGFIRAETHTAGEPGVAAVLAILDVLLGAWCAGRLWLEYLASLPSTIQVPDFSNPSEIAGISAEDLTTQFRNRLATLRLQSASVAPGTLPPSNFLDVLGQQASTDAVGRIAGILRATFPSTALVVRGTLLKREHSSRARFGVSLEVARLPNQGSRLQDVWDTSWQRAIRRAADGAIAAILPRTRLCRGPWVGWRGYEMPAELLQAYEEASDLTNERRYPAALESCYRALQHDPMNRAVRLQLGKLQEQLGLFLDALGTYEGILATAWSGRGRIPRRLYSRRARRERARMEHIARYRLIVLLSGHSVLEQWAQLRDQGEQERREDVEDFLLRIFAAPRRERRQWRRVLSEERATHIGEITAIGARYRWRLRPSSKQTSELMAARAEHERRLLGLERERSRKVEELLRPDGLEHMRPMEKISAKEALSLAFADCALRWADDLCRDLRRWRLRHPFGEPHLTRATVAVTRACVEERLDLVTLDDSADWSERLIKADERLASSVPFTGLRSWQSHYNAACLYALALIGEPCLVPPEWASVFARRAIDQLERGASISDSAYLATRRDWLIHEDPDLQGLRGAPEFRRFVSLYFPTVTPLRTRPPRVEDFVRAHYVRGLLGDVSRGWAGMWQQRSSALNEISDWRELAPWWRDEAEVWKLIARLSAGTGSWDSCVMLDCRQHVHAVEQLRGWNMTHGVEFAGTSFTRYEELVASREELGESGVWGEISKIRERLEHLRSVLEERTPEPPAVILQQSRLWAEQDGQVRPDKRVAEMCNGRAVLWSRLSSLLNAEPEEQEHSRRDFLKAIRKVHKLEPW